MSDIYKEFERNVLLWGMYYFPMYFRLESPGFHVKILNEAMVSRRLAVQAPRESAKSSILSFLYVFHSIVFGKKRHIGMVQNTFEKSKGRLEAIKDEVRNNEDIRRDYGITFDRDAQGDTVFVLRDGSKARVFCKGLDQLGSIRGELFGPWRPDLILFDDLEDDKLVQNPELRRDLEDIVNNAVIPAIDKEVGQHIVIGTILHDDCLMAKFVSRDYYKEYRKLFYIAKYEVDGQEESLWPQKWSLDSLREMEREKPEVFAKEYQGDPVSGKMRTFYKEDFRRWLIEDGHYVLFDSQGTVVRKGLLSTCKAAIGCDLAWDEDRRADYTAVIPGLLTVNNELLIDDYFLEKGVKPDYLAEIIFGMEEKYRGMTNKNVQIGFEKGKIEKFSKWFMKKAMSERNRYLLFKDIKWETDKISRIITPLQPRYRNHVIFHKSSMGELEHQLMRFPDGTHDDAADALQILVQLLEYAPTLKGQAQQSDDPKFDALRKYIIDSKKPRQHIFGKKGNRFNLPSRVCPI